MPIIALFTFKAHNTPQNITPPNSGELDDLFDMIDKMNDKKRKSLEVSVTKESQFLHLREGLTGRSFQSQEGKVKCDEETPIEEIRLKPTFGSESKK